SSRRAIQALETAGRQHRKWPGLDQRAIVRRDRINFFHDRRIGLLARPRPIDRFQFLDGRDGRHSFASEQWHLAPTMRIFKYVVINSICGIGVNKPPVLWIRAEVTPAQTVASSPAHSYKMNAAIIPDPMEL